jgi:hypothetical protein
MRVFTGICVAVWRAAAVDRSRRRRTEGMYPIITEIQRILESRKRSARCLKRPELRVIVLLLNIFVQKPPGRAGSLWTTARNAEHVYRTTRSGARFAAGGP